MGTVKEKQGHKNTNWIQEGDRPYAEHLEWKEKVNNDIAVFDSHGNGVPLVNERWRTPHDSGETRKGETSLVQDNRRNQ